MKRPAVGVTCPNLLVRPQARATLDLARCAPGPSLATTSYTHTSRANLRWLPALPG